MGSMMNGKSMSDSSSAMTCTGSRGKSLRLLKKQLKGKGYSYTSFAIRILHVEHGSVLRVMPIENIYYKQIVKIINNHPNTHLKKATNAELFQQISFSVRGGPRRDSAVTRCRGLACPMSGGVFSLRVAAARQACLEGSLGAVRVSGLYDV